MKELAFIFQRKVMPSLKHVDLSNNRIGNLGLHELNNTECEDVFSQIESLNLRNNSIGNEGAFVVFDCIRHRYWRNLQDLNMERNKFSPVTAVQLVSLLEMENQLQTLRIVEIKKKMEEQEEDSHQEKTMKEWELAMKDFVVADLIPQKETVETIVTTPTA